MHPEVDQKLYKEIVKYFDPTKPDELDHNTIQKMTYLDMVVKEVLRLYPVVPVTVRQNLKDTYVGMCSRKNFQ